MPQYFSSFFSNLSKEQIYGLLAGVFAVILLFIFSLNQIVASQTDNLTANGIGLAENSLAQSSNPAVSTTNSQTQNSQNNSQEQKADVSAISEESLSSNFSSESNTISAANSLKSDLEKEEKYYVGKIDNLPIRLILKEIKEEANKTFYEGKSIYEGVSKDFLTISASFSSGGNFSAEEIDVDDKTGVGKMTGVSDEKGKISGTWSSMDGTKSLPLELTKTEKFKLEDFLVKKDSLVSLELQGQCGAYAKDKCLLVNKNQPKVTLQNLDASFKELYPHFGNNCRDNRCGWQVDLGKKDESGQYILFEFPSVSYATNFPGLGSLGSKFMVSKYNFGTKKVEKIEEGEKMFLISWICSEKGNPTSEACDPDCSDAKREVAYQMKCFEFINKQESQEPKITLEQIETLKKINFDYLETREKYTA